MQTTRLERGELRAAREPAAEGFHPRYVFTPRLAGRLACGELAVEPVLGPVRVTGIRPPEDETGESPHVHIAWRDERGPGSAAGRYPADRSFPVRMPAPEDRLLVRRGIDQAKWRKREITDNIARLIAGHLHPGEGSALHGFMTDGSIGERVYDELEQAARHRFYARGWVDALTRYCLFREDPGPVAAWTKLATAEAEARAEEWLTAAGANVATLAQEATGHRNGRHHRYRSLLARKHIPTDTARQLIDAAFLLGVTAARKGTLPAVVERRLVEP